MTTQAPRVATITGSSRGIGASIAQRLAANGITVIAGVGLADLLSPSHELSSGRI
jgi:NAD(P)-dependent dehydrogenase (short-subunit alcohol dehydrogenase family)